MLHFSPQFVDFEIVRFREKQHSSEWRLADRKSKHLCRVQWELSLRTMFIEISGDPGTRLWVWDGAHNALALCIMSLLIADISEYLCFARVRTLQIEVDWQRGEHLSQICDWIQYLQSWVQVLRFHFWYCITSSLIRKDEHFEKNWTSIAKCCHLSGKFNREALCVSIHKGSDRRWNILYILNIFYSSVTLHKARRRNRGWSVLCQALYCRSLD